MEETNPDAAHAMQEDDQEETKATTESSVRLYKERS
jgi:hypothetical protein